MPSASKKMAIWKHLEGKLQWHVCCLSCLLSQDLLLLGSLTSLVGAGFLEMGHISQFSTSGLMEKERRKELLRQVMNIENYEQLNEQLWFVSFSPSPLHVLKSTAIPCCGMFAVALAFKVLQEMLFAELKGNCLLGLISVFSQYPLTH